MNIRDACSRWMPREQRLILVKLLEVFILQATHTPQRDVERSRRMSLGKYEAIFLAQELVKDDQHRVQRRQVATNMANTALEMHLQQSTASASQFSLRNHA